MENISNSTHDAPADGQTKTDAQKSNHCCNAPYYDYYRTVCLVIGLAKLAKVISPSWKYFHAPPNSKREENGLNKHPKVKIHIVLRLTCYSSEKVQCDFFHKWKVF